MKLYSHCVCYIDKYSQIIHLRSVLEHPTATLLEFRLLRWIHIFLLCTMLVEIFWFHHLVIQFVSLSSISEIQDHFDDTLFRAIQDAFPCETRVKAWFNKSYNEKSIYFGVTVIFTKSLRLFYNCRMQLKQREHLDFTHQRLPPY